MLGVTWWIGGSLRRKVVVLFLGTGLLLASGFLAVANYVAKRESTTSSSARASIWPPPWGDR